MRRRNTPATLDGIAHEVEKLCRNVQSLENSATRLGDRIQEFAEALDIQLDRSARSFREKPEATIQSILTVLIEADQRIEGAERYFGAIRSVIDQISNDSWSRADLKDYLDSKPKKKS